MSDRATLPAEMRAVVMKKPGDYRLETRPLPKTGPKDLLIQVDAVGICGSDIKCYHGAAKFWGGEGRAQWAQENTTPGHEIAGTVVDGSVEALEHHGVKLGERIVVEQIVPCGECRFCRRGEYWMCAPHDILGFRQFNGGMAEYMLVPEHALAYPISRDVKPEHAAFSEPLGCALHAVERARLRFEDVVVVAGAGPIGLGAIAGARLKNPHQIIALDFDDAKLELAKRCGADLTFNPSKVDVDAEIKKLTEGYGADVYIECTGNVKAVPQGVNLLRKLGRYVEYSVFGEEATVDWTIISDDKELDVLGAHLSPHTYPTAIRMLETGVLPMDDICTHQVGLEDFQKGFDLVADGSAPSVKVTILPQR